MMFSIDDLSISVRGFLCSTRSATFSCDHVIFPIILRSLELRRLRSRLTEFCLRPNVVVALSFAIMQKHRIHSSSRFFGVLELKSNSIVISLSALIPSYLTLSQFSSLLIPALSISCGTCSIGDEFERRRFSENRRQHRFHPELRWRWAAREKCSTDASEFDISISPWKSEFETNARVHLTYSHFPQDLFQEVA
jgi:hypothetical protein